MQMATNVTTEALKAALMPSSFLIEASDSNAVPFVEIGFASSSFILVCTALVMLMTPGVGLLYSGLTRSKNALTMVMLSFLCYSVVCIQWVIWGYSLTFSETGSRFIGNFANAGLAGVGISGHMSSLNIPVILFALYQMQFATVTAAIIFGSVTDRVRLLPSLIFIFFWTTVVYDPIAYWTWGPSGWLKLLGGLDFAGGGPVHMASGFSALAFCIFLGHRKRLPGDEFKPHNMTSVFLGTALLWFGWFGFNAGSALAATPRAAMAGMVTTIAASAGSLAWLSVDYIQRGKLSGVGFCSGAIAGLVAITPAAGFVAPWAAIVIGAIGGICCAYAIKLKDLLGFDDALDAFGIHGVGGLVGSLLTGIFTSKDLVAWMDGTVIPGGAIDGNWYLLAYNLAGAVSIISYSVVVTLVLLYGINLIPGLHFRPSIEEEHLGGNIF